MRSKLGFSAGLLGALVFFSALFGGIIPTVLVVGYILIFEDNAWLKHVALKGIILLFFFFIVTELLGLIPNVFSFFSTLLSIFSFGFDYSIVNAFFNTLIKAVGLLKTCLFLILGIQALSNKTIAIPFVDKFIQ